MRLLPTVLIEHVFGFLDATSLVTAETTSRRYRECARAADGRLWKRLLSNRVAFLCDSREGTNKTAFAQWQRLQFQMQPYQWNQTQLSLFGLSSVHLVR